MLQQMSSPAGALPADLALARARDARFSAGADLSSGASSDAAEEFELPQCKIRRNYNCAKCTFYTQNPRAFLLHTRDVHFEKFKIYDCPNCVYASRHYQKLVRHLKMVHSGPETAAVKPEPEVTVAVSQIEEPVEHIEDFLEEVEDADDVQLEGENGSMDIDVAEEPLEAVVPKGKSKYFSCNKCSYVTHIRARFTKHVKYHSMPMIKCTMCEFRTPYKWNLDRHMKNHGGSGNFTCSMCNFTADIKQSLTVHEMNHHTALVGQQAANRRRNRVGASDLPLEEYVGREEEESGDSHSSQASDMGPQYADIEMVSCNSESNDAVTSESMKNEHSQASPDSQNNHSKSSNEEQTQKQRKAPRPIPQLIPLNTPPPSTNKILPGEPPAKKFKESNPREDLKKLFKFENLPSDITIIPASNLPKEVTVRKKNESFFDRLKERLLTETGEEGSLNCKSCGFKSKCLSEHSVHEKNCSASSNRIATSTPVSNLSSTRCQNCRHRCKSSADLYNHLKTCKKSNQENQPVQIKPVEKIEVNQNNDVTGPHPMENVVFVWNDISHDSSKYNSPLGISINDDCTMPETNKTFESEIIDDNDSMNLSPSNAIGKKVFKCPHCAFWASTASRFHVHIVGHLNKKPFECSLCKYKSNWRWDITKHIKLKSARDPEHNDAKVLMTDETGRRNYSKYNRFLAMSITNENGENEFHYIDPNAQGEGILEVDDSLNDVNERSNTSQEPQTLDLQTQQCEVRNETVEIKQDDVKKPKRTLWKCKKCNYKDPSKDALLEHIKEHSSKFNKKPENLPDPADVAYCCGHCNQLSNWKHVIQRHCRLKHDGVINVITTVRPKQDPAGAPINDTAVDACTKCPFTTDDKKILQAHMQQHQPSPQSIFKCYYCDFFVKSEQELMNHLTLHGVTDPEEYLNTIKAMGGKSSPNQEPINATSVIPAKRHKCSDCPYETNSKSQYMYHEQFHRLPADTPYKCPECNYSVSKRHLLHQHLRVHGIIPKKNELDGEFDGASDKSELKFDSSINLEVIPFVWVSAKDEFHKMYKCRYCSYVNSQECKIPNHEKIHFISFENSDITIYKCLECKFTCDNALRLADHSKSHGEIYGRIYCPVEEDVPDEEQITKFRKVIEIEKSISEESAMKEEWSKDIDGVKILFFCQKCPSRFFTDCELKVHDKFHDLSFPNKCQSCEFSVAQEIDLKAHTLTHSDEYHTKTKMLKFAHNVHPAHREPKMEMTSDLIWIVSYPGKNYEIVEHAKKEGKHVSKQYLCKECPAKFFKSSALNSHMGLHGGEGDYKCKKCSYVVKNIGNLAKHELLHENESKLNCEYESGDDMDYKNIPLSGTDLFQRKTEAQKRVLTDKDKFVKPNDHFPPVLQADPQFGYLMHGNPEFIYPTYLKNGRQKEKRYKCHKCPSAFEKREQYKIHLSLHGSKQRYKCELCDYSVKYYANYVQHMRKHQMNDEAHAERKKSNSGLNESENEENKQEEKTEHIKLAIKTMPKGPPKGLVKSDFQQFSISDQQTLRLLQHRRTFIDDTKDLNEVSPVKERKQHLCLLCPYTNQRLDALNNHYRRHDDPEALNSSNNKCSYCDLVVVQSHFLREHLKTHFHYMKNLTAECYVANEDVKFTVTKMDQDTETTTDLILDTQYKLTSCKEDKIFVKLNTGELQVE